MWPGEPYAILRTADALRRSCAEDAPLAPVLPFRGSEVSGTIAVLRRVHCHSARPGGANRRPTACARRGNDSGHCPARGFGRAHRRAFVLRRTLEGTGGERYTWPALRPPSFEIRASGGNRSSPRALSGSSDAPFRNGPIRYAKHFSAAPNFKKERRLSGHRKSGMPIYIGHSTFPLRDRAHFHPIFHFFPLRISYCFHWKTLPSEWSSTCSAPKPYAGTASVDFSEVEFPLFCPFAGSFPGVSAQRPRPSERSKRLSVRL